MDECTKEQEAVCTVKRRSAIGEFFFSGSFLRLQGWGLIFCIALTFILMVSLPALISVERNEKTLTKLLADKGSALITAFESILATGLRSTAGVQMQTLLEELTKTKDVRFIAITMPDGTIIAHSNRSRIGEILNIEGKEADEATMHQLSPKGTVRWSVMQIEGVRCFVVYRNFLLAHRRPPHARRIMPIPKVFLGLDISPFEITKSQNRAYMTLLACVSIFIGLAIMLVIYFAERARLSRSRQQLAEGKVKELEEEVRRKEKLAVVGTLAAGVAHEIRNPLSSIKGYATYFGQRFPEESDDRKAATVMVREVERLNRVITDLIGLSRPTNVSLRAISIDTVIEHVTRLISQDAQQKKIEILIRLPHKTPQVNTDPDRLGQALLNLCLNAFDAMPQGGKLTLSVNQRQDKLDLCVKDSGTGISPERLGHIFDPYYTTKSTGTGIGLAIVHKIVEALHGEISVTSKEATEKHSGETIFCISLPTASKYETK